MTKTKVTQGRPRKETGSKRKEHYRQLWREASSRYYAETHGKPKLVKKVEKILLNPFIETKTESHWIREDTKIDTSPFIETKTESYWTRRDAKIDASLTVSVSEIKPETSKITSKTERDSYESIYRPKNLPTHYNLHKKVIKIIPGKHKSKRKKKLSQMKFERADITRICANIFRCNECGQMWSVNRKIFSYDGDWWRYRNGCNKDV